MAALEAAATTPEDGDDDDPVGVGCRSACIEYGVVVTVGRGSANAADDVDEEDVGMVAGGAGGRPKADPKSCPKPPDSKIDMDGAATSPKSSVSNSDAPLLEDPVLDDVDDEVCSVDCVSDAPGMESKFPPRRAGGAFGAIWCRLMVIYAK